MKSPTTDAPINFTKLPFGRGLAPEDLFSYSQLEELKRLVRLALEHKSPLMLSGESGIGKTTAIHAALYDLPTNKYSVIYLGQDQDGSNLTRRLAHSLGLQPKMSRKHTWMQIGQLLADNLIEQGKTPIVVIDEAHLLDDATLEDLRLLTNNDFDRTSPLSLILLGQLPLRTRLKSPGSEALSQRLRFRYALEGFTHDETAAYIKHHLRLAELSEDLFAPDAVKSIFLGSRGILREINNYCTLCILKAQSLSLSKIDAKLVRQVIDQTELN
jgi:type II secretory pathway predicted ATPase ExeA